MFTIENIKIKKFRFANLFRFEKYGKIKKSSELNMFKLKKSKFDNVWI
jgi:hypothetical protein